MGFGSNFLFNAKDLFTTSEAENKRNKYKKVIKDLNKQLKKIEEKLPEVNDTILSIHTKLMGNGDQSSGQMINDFEEKRDENKSKLNKLVSYYREMEDSVRDKLRVAQSEYARWSAIADKEDAEKKEYEEAQK